MTESTPESVPSFDEIRRIASELPGPDATARDAALAREPTLTKPAGALGDLEDLAAWAATWQGRHPPRVDRPRVCVFAGNHGVTARGVSAYPSAVTAEMVRNFIDGGAAVNQICGVSDAELRVYELSLEEPTADFTAAPAMEEEACARAMAYGMMAVEPGLDLLCVGEMGIGNTTVAAALSLALHGGAPEDWVGPGTGVSRDALGAKHRAVADGLALHGDRITDPFDALRRLGGFELAAICGAVIAARMGRVPVLLDGFVSTAAASVLHRVDPGALDHCRIGQASTEPGHGRLAEILGMKPLLNLGMRMGECAGAALAINIVRAAVRCHADMATFSGAGVSGPDAGTREV